MPLTTLAEPLGKRRAAHLLRRTTLGGSKTEVDLFAMLSPSEAVERLFQEDIPTAGFPIDPMTGEEWITQGNAQSEETDLIQNLLQWQLGLQLGIGVEEEQKLAFIFRERIVLFFHIHFTTKKSVVNNSRFLYYQQALFRDFAFDKNDKVIPPDPEDPESTETVYPKNFKELSKKLSLDNAMLVFLDGKQNVKGSPNENFARELLELYTIGKGLEGNIPAPEFAGDYFYFTEEDVVAGAKVFSGLDVDPALSTLDPETNIPRGNVKGGEIASSHETGSKTFSTRLGSAEIIPDETLQVGGRPTKESVLDEISQLITLIYDQEETALHICRRLYRFFVYHEVSQELQDDIVSEMASIFRSNEFKIQPVLEALLTSTHFYDAEEGVIDNNFGGLIKSPMDLVLGFFRNFEIDVPVFSENYVDHYGLMNQLMRQISLQGMDYYEPFEVAGYSAYHQFPIFNRSWITTNFLANRYGFIQAYLSNGENMEMGQLNVLQYVIDSFDPVTIRNVNDFIISVAEYLLPVAENLSFEASETSEITVARLNFFKQSMFAFSVDPDPEVGWTERWDNDRDPSTRAGQILALFNAMFQSPEYQLL